MSHTPPSVQYSQKVKEGRVWPSFRVIEGEGGG